MTRRPGPSRILTIKGRAGIDRASVGHAPSGACWIQEGIRRTDLDAAESQGIGLGDLGEFDAHHRATGQPLAIASHRANRFEQPVSSPQMSLMSLVPQKRAGSVRQGPGDLLEVQYRIMGGCVQFRSSLDSRLDGRQLRSSAACAEALAQIRQMPAGRAR